MDRKRDPEPPEHVNDARYAKHIRRLLHDKGMRQEDLAKEAKVTRATINANLNGGDPRMSTMYKIAGALKVDISMLFAPIVERPADAPPNALLAGIQPQIVDAIARLIMAGGVK